MALNQHVSYVIWVVRQFNHNWVCVLMAWCLSGTKTSAAIMMTLSSLAAIAVIIWITCSATNVGFMIFSVYINTRHCIQWASCLPRVLSASTTGCPHMSFSQSPGISCCQKDDVLNNVELFNSRGYLCYSIYQKIVLQIKVKYYRRKSMQIISLKDMLRIWVNVIVKRIWWGCDKIQQERCLKCRNILGGLEISMQHQIVNTLKLIPTTTSTPMKTKKTSF